MNSARSEKLSLEKWFLPDPGVRWTAAKTGAADAECRDLGTFVQNVLETD